MGSIASVLQWHCSSCALINPTEKTKCMRCGYSRRRREVSGVSECTGVEEEGPGYPDDSECSSLKIREVEGVQSDSRHIIGNTIVETCLTLNYNELPNTCIQNSCRNIGQYGVWCGSLPENTQRKLTFGALRKSRSLPTLVRQWMCTTCHLTNNSASESCAACTSAAHCSASNSTSTMASDQAPTIYFNDQHDLQEKEVSVSRILDTDVVSSTKSPKRQSLSVYERVKSKVSRSLSNGSVVHKKYTQPRRPSSLLLHPADTISNLVHVWSCARCTLYNSGETSRCEVCETPRKNTIPVSSPGHSLPRSSMVITVPDWDKNRSSDHLWVRPVYRRSHSEFLSNEVVKSENKDNLKTLADPVVQENSSLVHSSVNNLNVQLISGQASDLTTRYSYIGISEPREYPAMTTTPTAAQGLPNSATDPVDLKSVFCLKDNDLERMWTCIKCSYAYNPLISDNCDICWSVRSPPSLTEPSLITVTKDSVRYTPRKEQHNNLGPFKFPLDMDTDWTCRKCTLVNSGTAKACVVCGGSKLRSITSSRDMTLRKGEFWTCWQCTLRNPLDAHLCQACKARASSHSQTTNTASRLRVVEVGKSGSGGMNAARSPSPRHGKQKLIHSGGGAIPKQKAGRNLRKSVGESNSSEESRSWQCIHCTYENLGTASECEMCHSCRGAPFGILTTPVPLISSTTTSAKKESELVERLRQIEETDALDKWNTIIKYCTQNDEPFVDDSFPPAPKSLYYNGHEVKDNRVVQWLRPHQINADTEPGLSWAVFRTPLPSDISQGCDTVFTIVSA